ncbi:MAG: ribosome-recycling factor [Bacteroidota bacterium]
MNPKLGAYSRFFYIFINVTPKKKDLINEIELNQKEQKTIYYELIKSLNNINKADPSLINSIKIQTDSGLIALKSLSSIVGNNEQRNLKITPFDSQNIKFIKKTLWDEQMGNVLETKTEIILTLPPITKDYKEKILADTKKKTEEIKVRIRQIRQDFLNKLKDVKSEDEKKKKQKDIQNIIDKYVNKIENSIKEITKKGI